MCTIKDFENYCKKRDIKINLKNLNEIIFGDSKSAFVGDTVLAIGNPFGVGQTATQGIISALGRNKLNINTFEKPDSKF